MQTPPSPGPNDGSRYHVGREGVNLGAYSLGEIREKRAAGEFGGEELLWCAGMADWQPIDTILGHDRPAASPPPRPPPLPPLPKAASPAIRPLGLWIGDGLLALLLIGLMVLAAWSVFRVRDFIKNPSASSRDSLRAKVERRIEESGIFDTPEGMNLAGPIIWPVTSRTAADHRPAELDFRVRHYLNAYLKHARRDLPGDADAVSFIETWNQVWLEGATPQDSTRFWELHTKVAADESMQDPFVRILLVTSDTRITERIPRMERALRDFEGTTYPPLVRFWATISLISERGRRTIPLDELNASAVGLLRQAVRDGDLTPDDGVPVADRFLDRWAFFFNAHREEVCRIFADAGPEHRWTHLVLEGERQVALAWQARGGGYAGTVTSGGWEGFREGLAKARAAFTEAWELRPDRAQPAARMIYVAMGESREQDMRLWFDRALALRIDHLGAWRSLRFALYPRWHGSHEAMLKLGVEALNTRRFDTTVPGQFYDIVGDIEGDMKLPKGSHIYGRPDIWPNLRRMYEGYIADESNVAWRDGWRSAYACVAYLAEDYATARTQLEAVAWKPDPGTHSEWDIDLSFMPLEVAARTCAHAGLVARAETAWDRGETAEAKALFKTVLDEETDEHAREFARRRIAGAESAGF